MPLRNYLFIALAAALVSFWYVDRSRSFDRGKEQCQASIAEAQQEYHRRQAEQNKKDIERAVKEALAARDKISDINNDKPQVVERVREIIKTIPASCDVPAEFMREFNAANANLRRKH